MSKRTRLYDRLTKNDLEQLAARALAEQKDFFRRNACLQNAYGNSLIGIALCQGAASHYLNPKVGINDFDIWFFYRESKKTRFNCRRVKSIKNGYKGIKIDFLKKAIPEVLCGESVKNPDRCILKYLQSRHTTTSRFLLQKAIIGLYPRKMFNKIIWQGVK